MSSRTERRGAGITRLFRVRDDELPRETPTDENGFVLPFPGVLGVENLLCRKAVLVLAPPWTGKTHVAKAIDRQMRFGGAVGQPPGNWSPFCEVTLLEDQIAGRAILPDWWPKWQESHARAWWVIDALDEGERRTPGLCAEFLGAVKGLPSQARDRLTLIMFSRESSAELPPKVLPLLREIYADELLRVDLLGLDERNARAIAGERGFERAVAIVHRCDLKHIVAFPAVLDWLKSKPEDESLSDTEVWRGVLYELLREKNPERRQRRRTKAEIEDQFRAASRLAVAMTLGGLDELGGEGDAAGPIWTDVIPPDPKPYWPARDATREALLSAVFRRTAKGHRFAHRNLQEWMCAFGLSGLSLRRLKPLVTQEEGGLWPELLCMLWLLSKTTEDPEVKRRLTQEFGGVPPPADLGPLSLAQAAAVLDRLEQLAGSAQSSMGLWGERGLEWLATPGLGGVLAGRLGDLSRSSHARIVVCQVALAVDTADAVPPAVEVLLDRRADDELRRAAALLVARLGTDEELLALSAFVESATPTTRLLRCAVASVLLSLLRRGLWTVARSAPFAPEASVDVVDSTSLLARELEEGMSLEDARPILQQSAMLGARSSPAQTDADSPRGRGVSTVRERVYLKALKLILAQDPPVDDDLFELIPLALRLQELRFGQVLWSDFMRAFERSVGARRALYVRSFERQRSAKATGPERMWARVLLAEDLDWLFEQAPRLAQMDESVWQEVLWLAHWRATPLRRKRAIRAFFRANLPGTLTRFDRERRRRKRKTQRLEKKLEEQEEEGRKRLLPIELVARQILASDYLSDTQRMRELSWVCFVGEMFRPRNVNGAWSDLRQSVQEAVLDVCQRALEQAEPTPVPESASLPGAVMCEAECFRAVLKSRPERFVLTPHRIKRWLPSVLTLGSQDYPGVLATCQSVAPAATEHALLQEIRRVARIGAQSPVLAWNLPSEHWSEKFSHSIAGLVTDSTLQEDSRASLLRLLALRAPRYVLPLVSDLGSAQGVSVDAKPALAQAALDSLLVTHPDRAWPMVRREFQERGERCLVELTCLTSATSLEFQCNPLDWPAERLASLGRMLLTAFPPERDPHYGGAHWSGPEDHLRILRDQIPDRLFARCEPGDAEALEDFASEYPRLRRRLAAVRARVDAQGLLAGAPRADHARGPLSLHPSKIARFLDDDSYRLVRNNQDLLDVLQDELAAIGEGAQEHLPMLYRPEEIHGRTRRRHEDALQAYIQCRLTDRLPGKVLDRETKVKLRRRTDIKVIAPTVGGALATVVIEVKWSDNRDVAVSLERQLGEKYLVGQDESHGVYVVGWIGRYYWRREAGPRPGRDHLREPFLHALQEQANRFHRLHPGFVIVPVVLDVAWCEEGVA